MAETIEQIETRIKWLSDEEAHAIFDREARRVMGMSGPEFLQRYDAGEFAHAHEDGENLALMSLEFLIPWGR